MINIVFGERFEPHIIYLFILFIYLKLNDSTLRNTNIESKKCTYDNMAEHWTLQNTSNPSWGDSYVATYFSIAYILVFLKNFIFSNKQIHNFYRLCWVPLNVIIQLSFRCKFSRQARDPAAAMSSPTGRPTGRPKFERLDHNTHRAAWRHWRCDVATSRRL